MAIRPSVATNLENSKSCTTCGFRPLGISYQSLVSDPFNFIQKPHQNQATHALPRLQEQGKQWKLTGVLRWMRSWRAMAAMETPLRGAVCSITRSPRASRSSSAPSMRRLCSPTVCPYSLGAYSALYRSTASITGTCAQATKLTLAVLCFSRVTACEIFLNPSTSKQLNCTMICQQC